MAEDTRVLRSRKRPLAAATPGHFSPATITELPIECTDHIFSFLDVKSLLLCQLVCKDWSLISKDHVAHRAYLTIWQPLPFRKCDVGLNGQACVAVYKGSNPDTLASQLAGFTRLQELQTVNSWMEDEDLSTYIEVLLRNRETLTFLNVNRKILPVQNGLLFPLVKSLLTVNLEPEPLVNFPNLTRLEVSHQCSTDFLSYLPPSLLVLNVSFDREDFLLNDNHILDQVRGLRDLEINFDLSIDINLDVIIETVVTNNPLLKRLKIDEGKRGAVATDRSLTAIARLAHLNELCLYPDAPSFTTETVIGLILGMSTRPGLWIGITIPGCNCESWNSLFDRVQIPDTGSVHLKLRPQQDATFNLYVVPNASHMPE